MIDNKNNSKNKAAVISRFIKTKAVKQLKTSAVGIEHFRTVSKLKSEIELLTNYSSDAIYRLRYSNMEYDYISPSIERLLGYSVEEMKKINFRSLIVETKLVSDGMKSIDSYDSLEKNRMNREVNKWQADYRIKTKSGEEVWVSDISYPWLDKKGNIIGSIGCLRDISDRVRAEEYVRAELVRLANTDQLTGLSNRRAFFSRIEDEIKRTKRTGLDFSMLIIDIDHFKRINDTYGHDVGDAVINEIGKIITASLRETDLAARIGGEEFGVILPETPIDGAYWVAERIRNAVSKFRFQINNPNNYIKCTVCVGIADYSASFSSNDKNAESIPAELYKIADTRLYIAKNTGRNQVSMDELVSFH